MESPSLRLTLAGGCFLACLALPLPARANGDVPQPSGDAAPRELALGFENVPLTPPRHADTAPGANRQIRVDHGANVDVAAHLVATKPTDATRWSVRVHGQGGTLVQTIEDTAKCWDGGGCWTILAAGGTVTAELHTDGAANGLAIDADAYRFAEHPSGEAATEGNDDKRDVQAASAKAQKLAPAVVRLSIMTRGAYCTGFLLTSTLLITNEHCISTEADAESTSVDFNYQRPRAAPEKRLAIKTLEVADVAHDYAIVRLANAAEAKYGRFHLATAPVTKPLHLLLIQHPEGHRKMVTEADCEVVATDISGQGGAITDFRHSCDSETGSSGSPVIGVDDERVVGLHHWGRDPEGKPFNKAVRIDLVMNDLRNPPTCVPGICDPQKRKALADEIEAP